MVIYLHHPKHGTKVAVAEAEALADEANGWTRYKLDAGFPTDEGSADLAAQYLAKFGKKPHHKMKPETIRAELAA